MEKDNKIKELEEENKKLQEYITQIEEDLFNTKEHLKKYTAPSRNKNYYKNHKEELLEKMKSNPIPSEKRKEYNKNYYLKKINNKDI